MPKALITGITGQDGSYLAEFVSAKRYGAKVFLHYADGAALEVKFKGGLEAVGTNVSDA